MSKVNLVMGAVRGYSFENLRPFVLSLKKSGFNGDLCLLYNNLSTETIDELKTHNVILQPLDYRGSGALNSWSRFWEYLKPVVRILGTSAAGREIMKAITPLQTARFYAYRDFLKNNSDRYENVLLTDVRDVIFQTDPFTGFQSSKVNCYEEDNTLLEENVYNLPWIKQLFGDHAADSFANERIICSGTILGPVPEMIRYIRVMEAELIKAKDVGIAGSDQGLHNYVVRTKLGLPVEVIPNGTDRVLTIFDPNISTYTMKDGLFYNAKGNMIGVIHQYDRNKSLESSLLKRLLIA